MANEVKVEADIPQTVNYQTCTVQAGTTTTLASNQNATVTNSGTQYNAIFNFGIPSGKSAYEQAVAGGYTGTEAEFNAALASDITTVATNISDINTVGSDIANVNTVAGNTTNIDTVAGISSDVTTVAGISSDVTNVSGISNAIVAVDNNESAIQNVSDNLANVNSVASNMNSVLATAADITNIDTVANNTTNIDTVAGISTNVTTVAGIASDVTAVKNNAADISTVATNITDVGTVATNATAVSAVAADLTNIDAVNANKTNIDAVAGNNTNISAVATNISDVTSVATSIADVAAVAADLTNIDAVADDLTNIDTVAANISDVNATGQAIEDVSAVADNLTDISLVANDLENIDEVATRVAEWQRPSDWVDIRSGALDNSVYLLVAHSTPTESGGVYTVATYPKFIFYVTLSNTSHTYDIYVDGIKIASPTSSGYGTFYTIDWGALYTAGTVQTLHTTTHPSNLVYHIIRLTPTNSTDTIKYFRNAMTAADDAYKDQAILWAHYELSNSINISSAFAGEGRPHNYLLEAVTAKNDKITYTVAAAPSNSGFYSAFPGCSSLLKIPVLEAENQNYPSGVYIAFRNVPAKKVIIKNNKGTEDMHFLNSSEVQEFDIENGVRVNTGTGSVNIAYNAINIKKIPSLGKIQDGTNFYASNFTSLEDTVLDLSSANSLTTFRLYGDNATKKVNGLKGLTVSSSAPFNGASPQISVRHTGLNRQALVNLFKSMPTVSAGQVCQITGATGAADLTAEDLAIATGKGWTVTR